MAVCLDSDPDKSPLIRVKFAVCLTDKPVHIATASPATDPHVYSLYGEIVLAANVYVRYICREVQPWWIISDV